MSDAKFTVYFIGGQNPGANHSDTIEELEKVGAQLVPVPRYETEDEIIEHTADADALIVSEAPITRRVLSSYDHCKAVLRTGVGFDCIDVPAATDNNIAVINVPDLWTREVANQAMMLLLSINRKLLEQERSVRENRWTPRISAPVGPLHTETAGVVGLGRIGSAFAQGGRPWLPTGLGLLSVAAAAWLLLGPVGLVVLILVSFLALLLGWWSVKRLGGGLTGDCYGAANEIMEAMSLTLLSVLLALTYFGSYLVHVGYGSGIVHSIPIPIAIGFPPESVGWWSYPAS